MRKNKKLMITVVTITIVLLSVVGSYAFFTSAINNDNKTTAELNTATLSLTFADNDNGINERLMFGESVTKKYTITNTGTRDASMSLDWKDLKNTYLSGSLTYNLSYSETENGEYKIIVPESNVPTSREPLTQTLAGELSVPAGETYYYNLTITLNNLKDIDQTADKDAIFNTRFRAAQPLKYRYYTLTVDPNGGTWGEFTAPQEYLLKNNETKEIAGTPTRTGYTFSGWKIQGTSSELNDTTFTMGISDTYLVAQWTPNKYNLTINLDGGSYTGDTNVEVIYLEPTPIKIPTKKGYTFTGWNVTGGRVENNTFTLTEPNDASITATWQINNYKYIVYHNQMNIDGNGYSLVSADTDEGEATYNTTINPSVKTYTGFTSPSIKSLTIDEETEYPPTKNVINYNYDRNKYYLTININGGTYTGTNPVEMYYGASTTLNVPTKTGYNFTSWSATSGTLNENTFTMNDSNAEVSANYTPKEYSVTFNVNGGVVDTPSKKVTYDSTYGTLPKPIYGPYIFIGWFTEQENGTQITENTKVDITTDQTLYAHWKVIGSDVTIANLGVTPKEGTPNYANPATTDEDVYSMPDDYGTSYYYRGAVTNNYVKFANVFWRIVRVNGDGSIRMIYDGTQAYDNGVNNIDRVAITNTPWNVTNGQDAKYIGYKYGGANGVASTSKEQAQINETNTNIKIQLELWYKTNIEDQGLGQYISDEIFCNDRSIPGKTETLWTSDTGLGYATNITAYGALNRFLTGNNSPSLSAKSNPKPQFTCQQKNDAFTKDDEVNGNSELEFPVGLITADEIITAGGTYGIENSNYYLFKGTTYWTMSPTYVNGASARVFVSSNIAGLSFSRVYDNTVSIAPVINLSPETAITLVGDGTASIPFEIPKEI